MWHISEKERYTHGFGGRPEGNAALGRPRRRWENTIKMDLQEMEWVYGLD
jgi:hypothetical protein